MAASARRAPRCGDATAAAPAHPPRPARPAPPTAAPQARCCPGRRHLHRDWPPVPADQIMPAAQWAHVRPSLPAPRLPRPRPRGRRRAAQATLQPREARQPGLEQRDEGDRQWSPAHRLLSLWLGVAPVPAGLTAPGPARAWRAARVTPWRAAFEEQLDCWSRSACALAALPAEGPAAHPTEWGAGRQRSCCPRTPRDLQRARPARWPTRLRPHTSAMQQWHRHALCIASPVRPQQRLGVRCTRRHRWGQNGAPHFSTDTRAIMRLTACRPQGAALRRPRAAEQLRAHLPPGAIVRQAAPHRTAAAAPAPRSNRRALAGPPPATLSPPADTCWKYLFLRIRMPPQPCAATAAVRAASLLFKVNVRATRSAYSPRPCELVVKHASGIRNRT